MGARIKGLWKVLFGRTTIFVFLIVIQLAVIIGGIGFLGMKEVLIANYVVGVLAIIVLITFFHCCEHLVVDNDERAIGTNLICVSVIQFFF